MNINARIRYVSLLTTIESETPPCKGWNFIDEYNTIWLVAETPTTALVLSQEPVWNVSLRTSNVFGPIQIFLKLKRQLQISEITEIRKNLQELGIKDVLVSYKSDPQYIIIPSGQLKNMDIVVPKSINGINIVIEDGVDQL